MIKRIFDILFSFLVLIILLPAFILISLLIKTTMPGPVFFTQSRIGKDGRVFMLYKFRSMKVSNISNYQNFEPGNTARVTRFGKILRRLKLDELPQFLNVLKSEMSIVGPRPEVEKWVKVYPERWKRILSVKPGITDSSSILFRNEENTCFLNLMILKKLTEILYCQ